MLETVSVQESDSLQPLSRSVALRAELEATRAAFHGLLDRLTPAEWRQKSPTSAWTVGEVLMHLIWALEYLPQEVQQARRGRGMFNQPKWIADPFSYWYIRWLARTAAPASMARRYDQAMDAALRLLDTIPEADWPRGADFYGEGFHSVEDLFHAPAQHLADHTAGL